MRRGRFSRSVAVSGYSFACPLVGLFKSPINLTVTVRFCFVCPSVLYKTCKKRKHFIQEKLILRLIFNLGLALNGF